MVCCSAVIHLIIYFFILEFHFPTRFKEAPVYYVDIMNLPVADPQAGTPSAGENPSPPSSPAPPEKREMLLPVKPPEKISPRQTVAKPPKQPETTQSTREFEERIARLEREAGARNTDEAIEAMRKRGTGKGAVGMPGATGKEAGSDYAGFIRSRLEDSFRQVDTFKPVPGREVIVRLIIDRNGRIASLRYERRSNDQMFDIAVDRAIARAEKEFRPPPGGGQFEHIYSFKPQGVGKK
jgi:colicin import membrane protein